MSFKSEQGIKKWKEEEEEKIKKKRRINAALLWLYYIDLYEFLVGVLLPLKGSRRK
jgi:hypothetical protein